jgi:hypothetical protein
MIYVILMAVGATLVLVAQWVTKENFTEVLLNTYRSASGKVAAAEAAVQREKIKLDNATAAMRKAL